MPIRPSKHPHFWATESKIIEMMPNDITALPNPFKDILVTFLADVSKEGQRLKDSNTIPLVKSLELFFGGGIKVCCESLW